MHLQVAQLFKKSLLLIAVLLNLSFPVFGWDDISVEEIQTLAQEGNSAAQLQLAIMYQNGHRVPQSYAEAANYYAMAAEQGNELAATNLAVLYENGLGVPQSFANAATFYRMGAEKGVVTAQASLGFFYQNGQGVEQDDEQAVDRKS